MENQHGGRSRGRERRTCFFKLSRGDTQMIKRFFSFLAVGLVAGPMTAHSALMPIGMGDFSGAETVIDYGPTETGVPVDGVTIGGVLLNFSVGGSPSNDAIIDGGPGHTNHITVANIEGPSTGVLSLLFPSLQNRIGYGFAVLAIGNVANVTTIEVFDAANMSLGSLSFNGVPDPNFPGGFAGLESTVPFLRAEVRWSPQTEAFAFDNLRFEPVPEPGTMLLLGAGLVGVVGATRRKRKA
jgi:hypothetical protein